MNAQDIINTILGVIGILGAVYGTYMWAVNKGRDEANHNNELSNIDDKYKKLECKEDNSLSELVKENLRVSRSNNEMLQFICKWMKRVDARID